MRNSDLLKVNEMHIFNTVLITMKIEIKSIEMEINNIQFYFYLVDKVSN